MSAVPAIDLARLLQLKTVRDAPSRALFLTAIRELGRDEGAFERERLDAMIAIEEHFQALLLYDQLDFLREPPAISEAERDFALNIQRICLEAANGFQRFLRRRDEWADLQARLEATVRVTGLAMSAIHCFVKWGYFLNEPGRSTPWKQVHALFALAEAEGFAQVPFVLHASQPSFKPTVQALYLRTLILDLINSGSLSRVQIEIADGWLSSWCADYGLDAQYSSRQHLFCVDLASESGMQLVEKGGHGDSVRYVRADGLKAQIEEVQAGLRHGRLYAGHGAGAVFPVEEHVALLAIIEKLYRSILAGSENRVEERTHFEDREVDVTVGIERVLRKMREAPAKAAPAPATAVPAAAAETIEISPAGLSLVAVEASADPAAGTPADPDVWRWRVYDLSSRGFGLLVDRAEAEQVQLNGLIALRNQESGGWIVANVVRKLANRVRGEILAGIEVLAYRPVRLELSRGDGEGRVEALYLPGIDANGKLDSVLLRVGDFAAERAFALTASGRTFRVRLNRILARGADWIRVRFEIEARS